LGTNHSSGAERSMCNKFGYVLTNNISNKAYNCLYLIFVCVTLIGVKSKYGSCSGNCTGIIDNNNTQKYNKYNLIIQKKTNLIICIIDEN